MPEFGILPDSGHLTLGTLAAELAAITLDKTFSDSMAIQALKKVSTIWQKD
ncbi:hypothetical protein [Photorhabdus akhurstii]|uniref:hypothetical protein n=1 Tax=Photorhabdus akhurstii TaxID=171438 RepID=UPI0037045E88